VQRRVPATGEGGRTGGSGASAVSPSAESRAAAAVFGRNERVQDLVTSPPQGPRRAHAPAAVVACHPTVCACPAVLRAARPVARAARAVTLEGHPCHMTLRAGEWAMGARASFRLREVRFDSGSQCVWKRTFLALAGGSVLLPMLLPIARGDTDFTIRHFVNRSEDCSTKNRKQEQKLK
jgi:hypothetical protein